MALGAQFFQFDAEGNRNTISFASLTLLPAETRYSVTFPEMASLPDWNFRRRLVRQQSADSFVALQIIYPSTHPLDSGFTRL